MYPQVIFTSLQASKLNENLGQLLIGKASGRQWHPFDPINLVAYSLRGWPMKERSGTYASLELHGTNQDDLGSLQVPGSYK